MRLEVGDPAARLVREVYIDGARVLTCIAVDTDEGWADLVVMDDKRSANGMIRETGVRVVNGKIVTERVYGRIEIVGENLSDA